MFVVAGGEQHVLPGRIGLHTCIRIKQVRYSSYFLQIFGGSEAVCFAESFILFTQRNAGLFKIEVI